MIFASINVFIKDLSYSPLHIFLGRGFDDGCEVINFELIFLGYLLPTTMKKNYSYLIYRSIQLDNEGKRGGKILSEFEHYYSLLFCSNSKENEIINPRNFEEFIRIYSFVTIWGSYQMLFKFKFHWSHDSAQVHTLQLLTSPKVCSERKSPKNGKKE